MPISLLPARERRPKLGKSGFDQTPDHGIIHVRITVDQDISKRNQPAIIGDSSGERGVPLGKLADGFPADFKLALDGGAEQPAQLGRRPMSCRQ